MDDTFYREVIEASDMAYAYHRIVLDESGTPSDYEYLEVNASFLRMTGLPEGIVGRRVLEVIPNIRKEHFDWVAEVGRVALGGSPMQFEQFAESLGRWYRVKVYSPKEAHFICLFLDITEEKAQLEELDGFFDVNLDLLCIADLKGRFLKVNREWENVLGYPKEALEGAMFLDFVHPDDMQSTLDIMKELSGQKPLLKFVNRYRCRDGSYRVIEWKSHPNGEKLYGAARDVTLQKQMEAQLKERNEQFELAIKGSNDGIWDWNLETNSLYLSPRWKAQLGYRDDELENRIETFFHLIYSEDRAEIGKRINEYLNGTSQQDHYDSTFRMMHKDGRVRWIRARGEALRRDDGVAYRMAGSHTDVTEQKEVERENLESRQNFQLFFETMEDMVFIADLEGRVFFANATASRKLGYTDDELSNMKFPDFHPHQDDAKAAHNFAAMLAGERDFCPLPYVTKGGQIIPVETRFWFGHWNDSACVFALAKDLSVEQEAMHRFQRIFNNNPALMALINSESFQFMDVNEMFLQTLGFSKKDIIGRTVASVDLFSDEKLMGRLQDIMDEKGGIKGQEVMVRRQDGSHITGLLSLEVLEDRQESTYLVVMSDITELKQTEVALMRAKVEAEQANSMKSQFLANMSHEIRTPMNGVLGYLDLLRHTALDEEQHAFLGNAETASQMLLYLINDVLDYSRIEAGKLVLDNQPFLLRNTVEDAVSAMVPRAEEKQLSLYSYIRPEVPEEVVGDPSRLRQVLNNLLGNALKFTETGEVHLSVDCLERGAETAVLEFRVKDTGIGILPEHLEHLFQPFMQADAGTSRRYGGTGLGLAISSDLVKLMGGALSVESELNRGSVFVFTIHVALAAHERLSKKYEALQGVRVLVVDLESESLDILKSYLETAGCRVVEARSVERAITSVLMQNEGEEPIQLALIDMQLNDMTGIELADTMDRLPRAKGIRRVLMSSATRRGDALHAREHGFSGYVSKPVRRDEVLGALSAALNADYVISGGKSRKSPESEPFVGRAKPRLLVVEDNELNQKLMQSMLHQHQLDCDLAGNGNEALDAISRKEYDLVFMDCQMPGMDGYDCTRVIRQNEKQGVHLPIVAMTAYAMQGDREKCLQAGMDDYLAKPMERKRLIEMIDKYAGTMKPLPEIPEFVLDHLPVFIQHTGFEPEEAHAFYQDWLKELPGLIGQIRKNLLGKKFPEVARVAHTIKGVASNLYISEVREWAEKLEQAAKREDLTECEAWLSHLCGVTDMTSNC